jgi:hypothetical protein
MKIRLDKNLVLTVSKDQVSATLTPDLTEGIVILSLKDGMYYELKEVAARVWSLIQQPCSIQSIHDVLLEEYAVEAERCKADLTALVEDLFRLGLIEKGK